MSRALTPKSQFENFRKDAKRWLKALRAGDPKARQRLASAWPEAPVEPALRDVQHALSREYGFANWAALKAALDDLALARQSRAERVETVLRHGWDGDPGVARRILRHDPSIARENIFTAATCGDIDEVKRRLAAQPDAATQTGGPHNWTALACVAFGRLDTLNALTIARLLLDAGADPNFGFDDGWGNPFKLVTGAIGLGEGVKPTHPQAVQLVDLFIAAGADPFDTQTLYNTSIVGDDVFWTDLLWRRCEAQGKTHLWLDGPAPGLIARVPQSPVNYLLGNAVGSNHVNRVAWLLDHGADPDAPHAYTGQPVHTLARLSGFSAIAALLEQRGAQVHALRGVQAFQAACLAGEDAVARALSKDDPGLIQSAEPLLAAAMFGNRAAVDLLLSLGADVGSVDPEGISPLHRAVQSGDAPTVDRLIEAGADVNLREKKWNGTALSWAAVLGRPNLVPRLAPISRDVGALAALGEAERLEAVLKDDPALARPAPQRDERPTPLFCLPGDETAAVVIARLLLAYGADPKVKNSNGKTAIQYARDLGLDEAADLMESNLHG